MPPDLSDPARTHVKSDTAGKLRQPSSSPPVARAPQPEREKPVGREYRRIDAEVIIPRAISPAAAVSSPVQVVERGADVAEALQHFVFSHGQYFDSYLATEPGRQYFWSRSGQGVISYTSRGVFILVGGGLIAPEEHKDELLGEFVEFASQRRMRIGFHNLGDADLPLFRKWGFEVTKWGEEPVIDLDSWTTSGKAFEWVRRQTNFCVRHGVTAFEVRPDELEPEQWSRTLSEVLEVSRESLSLKAQASEMKFFEGRIDNHDLGLRRLFVARSGHGAGRMEGFLILNPILGGTAWSTELYRHRIDSVRGTIAFLFHQVFNQLQAEGVRRVDMCLDPGLRIETPMKGDSFLVRRFLAFGDRHLGFIFDNAGLRHFKTRFRPRYENRYVCSRPKVSLGSLIAFTRVFGVFDLSYTKLARVIIGRLRKRASRKTLSDAA